MEVLDALTHTNLHVRELDVDGCKDRGLDNGNCVDHDHAADEGKGQQGTSFLRGAQAQAVGVLIIRFHFMKCPVIVKHSFPITIPYSFIQTPKP